MHGGMLAGMGLWMLAWALLALAVLGLAVLGIVALVRHMSTPNTLGAWTGRQPDKAFSPRPPDRIPP